MAKFNTNSNTYTIVYAAIITVISAFLLAFVSSALKPQQDANVAIDKKQQILSALNMRNVDKTVATETFAKIIKADMIYGSTPDEVKNEGTEATKDQAGFTVESKKITQDNRPFYVAEVDGETKYVIPVTGAGLWGGLWGYIALNSDCQTVFGSYFSHESETAGLGARIVETWFQESFNGKKLFANDDDSKVALSVLKKGKEGTMDKSNYVNAITGATLTCNGVHDMVQKGLDRYLDILKSLQSKSK